MNPVVIIAIAFVMLIPTTVFGENVQTTLDDKKTVMIPITSATVKTSHLSTESKILSIELISRANEVEITIPRYFLDSQEFCEDSDFNIIVNGFPVDDFSIIDQASSRTVILNINSLEKQLNTNEYFIAIEGTHANTPLSKIEKNCNFGNKYNGNPSWYMISNNNDQEGVYTKNNVGFVSQLGNYHVIGEIVNNQNQAINFVQILGQVYDSQDRVLDTSTTFSEIDVIPAYGKSVYEIIFTGDGTVVDSFSILVDWQNTNEMPQKLEILNPELKLERTGNFKILGSVKNHADSTANFVKIVGAVYDKNGELNGHQFTFTEFTDVYPDTSSDFELIISDYFEYPMFVQLYVQSNEFGMIYDPISNYTPKVPEWVKNNAKWWADGQVDDSTFTQGIGFLIKEKIIGIASLPEQASDVAEQKVPDWIKNNAGWWADGMISEDDFIKGIKYLVESGIIKVD